MRRNISMHLVIGGLIALLMGAAAPALVAIQVKRRRQAGEQLGNRP